MLSLANRIVFLLLQPWVGALFRLIRTLQSFCVAQQVKEGTSVVTAALRVQSLAQELSTCGWHGKKKKKKSSLSQNACLFISWAASPSLTSLPANAGILDLGP